MRELADHFDTTERTIWRDLAALDELGIPLVRDERGYRLVEGATLRPLALDAAERAVLRLALANPAIRRTKALARRLEILASKLESLAPDPAPMHVVLAGVDRSGPIQPGVVESLERAMEQGTPIEIDYASLRSGKRSRRGIDPWAMFHRAEAWYLVGKCHRHEEARLFRLDRIGAVRQMDGTFDRPADFDVESFLSGAWSLHHGAARHEVVIRFDPSLAPLIANARHHEGERVERLPDGSLEYRVTLADLEEIARWIAGFAGRAVALAPPALVARVREMAEALAAAHPTTPKLRAVAKVATSRRRRRA